MIMGFGARGLMIGDSVKAAVGFKINSEEGTGKDS